MNKHLITSKPYHISKRSKINYYAKSTILFHTFRKFYKASQIVLKSITGSKNKYCKYRKYRWTYGLND